MSVYGTDPLYSLGAIENARIWRDVYPDWDLRVYITGGNPAAKTLKSMGVDVRKMPVPGGIFGMFWRFFAASDPGADAIIFRDADSRLNAREAAAVDEWLNDGTAFHVMRDHPDHAHWPMLGGMWGVRGGVIPHMDSIIEKWGVWDEKLDDMRFLMATIWPLAQRDMTHHSSVPTPHRDGRPFPETVHKGFVGEIVRVNGGGVLA